MYTKEIAATVRKELKEALPGWKFSVVYESYSGGSAINLSLMEGPEAVGSGYAQLNHYDLIRHTYDQRPAYNMQTQLNAKGWEVMKKATELLAQYHWDKSDAMVDYFCCNFYMHVAIGKWNKPYEIRGSK